MKLTRIKMTRPLNIFVLLILLAVQVQVAFGQTKTSPATTKLNTTVRITSVGDANIAFEYGLGATHYQSIKKEVGSAMAFTRSIASHMGWKEVRNLTGRFNDKENKILSGLTRIAYSKPYKEGRWAVNLASQNMRFLSLSQGVARFETTTKTNTSVMEKTFVVHLPLGSTDHKYSQYTRMLTYNFVPKFESNSGDIDFTLEAKPKLMSSFAKVYGDEKFEKFWTARSKFHNAGGQVIRNLRIRYRITNLSTWSQWKKSAVVYPNQTVVEAFFPVFDTDKLAQFTNARTAMVEVEYRYDMNNKTKTDTDTRKIKILGRNEVLWGSKPMATVRNWHELFDNSEMIATVFSSSNDPVMQQVAGVVTRMGGGVSQSTDKGAKHFLRTMWKFMEINKISYQSPVGTRLEGYLSQHIKFGRDVISNRAGTCIDLSVLWVSVAKAVGLKSYIVLVPGHAFPVIQLPSGEQVAIESTMIRSGSYDEAIKRGSINLKIAQGKIKTDDNGKAIKNAGLMIVCDINKMRSRGVSSIDLPRVVDGYLLKLGYKFNVQIAENQPTKFPKSLHGTWVSYQGTYRIGVYMGANGEYVCMERTYDNYGNIYSENTAKGTWYAKGSTFYISTNNGKNTGKFQVQNGKLIVDIDGERVVFVKK